MTPEQKKAYQSFGTVPERAAYLLDLGVTARTSVLGLKLAAQAAWIRRRRVCSHDST